MPKVSVVVPVYGVEPYIGRCLESLFGQTLDDIEYLFVDDATPDESVSKIYEALERYPHRKPRTKVLRHEVNRGLAAARTTGLRAATGTYVISCDPDDYVERDIYEKLYTRAVETDADIVACHFWVEDGQKNRMAYTYSDTPQQCLKEMCKIGCTYLTVWDKLVRRALIVRHGIYPYEGSDYGEDLNCVVRYFYYARTIQVVGEPLYHYCPRADSISGAPQKRETFEKRMKNVDRICEFLHGQSGTTYESFCNRMKFSLKREYRPLFEGDEAAWFRLYRESHRDILSYTAYPFKSRLVLWLAYRNLPMYRLMKRIFWGV